MSLPLEEHARSLLASVLMDEHEELTPELLESSIRSLRRRVFLRQLEDLQVQLKEAERRQDSASCRETAARTGKAPACDERNSGRRVVVIDTPTLGKDPSAVSGDYF